MHPKARPVNQGENPRRRLTMLKTMTRAATLAVFFCSVPANAYPLHQGEYAYWPCMPAASQVLADVKGTNDLDTAARQHAAFVLLIALVNISADGTGQLPWPARERQLKSAYSKALPDINGSLGAHRDEILAESLQLQADDSFVRPFLRRYFSEAALAEIQPMVAGLEASARNQIEASGVVAAAPVAPSAQPSNDAASSVPPPSNPIAAPGNGQAFPPGSSPHVFADEHFQISIPDKWNDTTKPGELVSAQNGDDTGISIFAKPLGAGYAVRLSDVCNNMEATYAKNGLETVRKGTFHFHGVPSGFLTSKGNRDGVAFFTESIFFVQGTDVISITMVGPNDPYQDPQFKQILDTFSPIPAASGTPSAPPSAAPSG